jgi:hypothetical protein
MASSGRASYNPGPLAPATVPRKLLAARTNQLRAGQIAALMLVDFETVDIR